MASRPENIRAKVKKKFDGKLLLDFPKETLLSAAEVGSQASGIIIHGRARRIRLLTISEEQLNSVDSGGWTVFDEDEREAADLWFSEQEYENAEGMLGDIFVEIGASSFVLKLPKNLHPTHIKMGQAYLVFTEVFSIVYTVSGDVGKILEELEMFATVYDLEDAQLDFITFSLKGNPMTEADRDIIEERFFTISDVGEIDGCNVDYPIPQKIVFSR